MKHVELTPPETVEFPGRYWLPDPATTRPEALAQLRSLAATFEKGSVALGGLYLRICDHIRKFGITPPEARKELAAAGYPAPKISELIKVANAPEAVYHEYHSRNVGFRATLRKTRLYYMAGRHRKQYKQRLLQRASLRLCLRMAEVGVREHRFAHGDYRLEARREAVCYILFCGFL